MNKEQDSSIAILVDKFQKIYERDLSKGDRIPSYISGEPRKAYHSLGAIIL